MPRTTGADEAAGTTAEALPSQARRGYGLGSVVTGSFGAVPGLLLLRFLTDRSEHPAGRRRPFILRAGLALAVCFALLFLGPTGPAWLGAAWVAVLYLVCASAYAFFQVPYMAMPAEMTADPDGSARGGRPVGRPSTPAG